MCAMDSRAFYDDYVGRQVAVGVNQRHHAIMAWLRRFGLRPGHRVLEVGAGVGTLTQLLVAEVTEGRVTAVDLSPKSIDAARERLGGEARLTLEAGDVLEMPLEGPFDVIVLPDVLEHIPLEHHGRLFQRLAGWLEPDGFVLAHYPNPWFLAWCHEHRPDLLQLVDQPIHAHAVSAAASAAGLYLAHLETYSIWVLEGDYVAAVFRPSASATRFTLPEAEQPSLLRRILGRLKRLGA